MTDTWTQKANLSFDMQRPVASVVNNKAYVGPMKVNGAYSKHFWEYNPTGDTWTQKADFSGTARELCSGFALDGKVYHGCGVDGAYKQDFYEYNPSTNVWTNKASFGGGIRHSATGFAIGSLGYMGLGSFGGGASNQSGDWWEYNATSNTWTSKANFTGTGNKRASAGGFNIGTVGYVVYGSYNDGSTFRPIDCNEYNPSTNAWTNKATPPGVGRTESISFSIGLYGYVGTGWSGTVKLNNFQKYDSVLNSWSTLSIYPAGITMSAVGFAILNKGYITGGVVDQNGNYEWCCGVTTYIISGNVKDSDGNNLNNVTIALVNSTNYSTSTNVSGNYSQAVDPDVYIVTASLTGYISSSTSVDASSGDQTQNFTLSKPVLSGTVTDEFNNPIRDADITISNGTTYTTTTDENGDYSQVVSSDTYDIAVSKSRSTYHDITTSSVAVTADTTQDITMLLDKILGRQNAIKGISIPGGISMGRSRR